ncbi:MAG: hypothetical protein IJU72_10605 [Bacteroidales bacterium]|nr:hypothetical protein [Bacteroidales bacterium]
MKPYRMPIIVLLALTSTAMAWGQQAQPELRATARFERDTILLGDPVRYTAVLEVPITMQAYMPIIPDSIGFGIELLAPPHIDTLRGPASTTYTLELLVTAFDSGAVLMPAIPFGLGRHGQVADTGLFPPQLLIVNLVPRDSSVAGIHDIKPPMAEPITLAEVAPWVGVGLLLLTIIVLSIIYIRKRRQNRPFLKIFTPSEPPHVVALRAIGQMREQKLWATEEHKLFYTQLTDVLRAYLEGRFGVEAQEKTTAEIMAALRGAGYDFGPSLEPLGDLLSTADLVKFAKHSPLIDENIRHLELSEGFVRSTMPTPQPDAPNASPQ